VTYKSYPVCAITQSPVQIVLDMLAKDDLSADQATAIRCYLNPADRSYPGTVNSGPFGDVGATLMSAEFCVAMTLKNGEATLAGLQEFDDETIMRLVGATEVIGDEMLVNLAARVEIDTADGRTLVGEIIPDASTYGWDWAGVVNNAEAMLPEMAVDAARLSELVQVVEGVLELDNVEPLVAATLS
jgi:2-methylcitrate dehydratase PrpD